jgi:hypothetical protein
VKEQFGEATEEEAGGLAAGSHALEEVGEDGGEGRASPDGEIDEGLAAMPRLHLGRDVLEVLELDRCEEG